MEPQPRPIGIEARLTPPQKSRQEVAILGNAGQHVITAGEVLALAALTAGMDVSQKSEYDVTVLRGPSVTEVVLSPQPIDYHGSTAPTVVVALAEEGVSARRDLLNRISCDALVLQAVGIEIPATAAELVQVDFRAMGLKRSDWALAALCLLARMNRVVSRDMLRASLEMRFKDKIPEEVSLLV
ncbi:MAG: 2-oxoacid:acceptor oxidoreductase family protein [Deltaproteobacteria bacterium]|nr:2-oxoacid:acceptor oxidoreductase family protein [Deltaproteobacteria bacterium]